VTSPTVAVAVRLWLETIGATSPPVVVEGLDAVVRELVPDAFMALPLDDVHEPDFQLLYEGMRALDVGLLKVTVVHLVLIQAFELARILGFAEVNTPAPVPPP
jgi:hypothetical protein